MRHFLFSFFIFFIFLISISVISAIIVYPGDTIIINNSLGSDNLIYTIIGNSTSLDSLMIEINATEIKIILPQDLPLEPFSLVFLENGTFKVIEEVNINSGVSGHGSSSCAYDIKFDWNCTEWSVCINRTQARTCKLKNNCGTAYGMPERMRVCFEEEITWSNLTDKSDILNTSDISHLYNNGTGLVFEDDDIIKRDYTWVWVIVIVLVIIIIIISLGIILNFQRNI